MLFFWYFRERKDATHKIIKLSTLKGSYENLKCYSTQRKKRMKKLFLAYSLALIAPVLLASCGKSNKQDPVNQTEIKTEQQIKDEGITKMPEINTKITTPSGLGYLTEVAGTGATPTKGKPVTVHYTGWLDVNGEKGAKFDSSVDRNQPFNFIIGVGQVIQGWDEGVQSMTVGEKRRLFIPADLGYGARGAGKVIPPNANLIFDVELLKVG